MVVRAQMRDGLDLSPNHKHRPITSIKDYKRYKMYIIKNGEKKPKEIVFGDVSWRSNIESLGVELSVSIPRNVDDRHLSSYDIIEIGDGVIFKNLNEVIFEGMVEDIDTKRYQKDIVCYDFGHLLGKTTILKQFNKIKGHSAIQSICREQNIPVGKVETMGVNITEIYKNQSISDIFKDIIEKENTNTGKRITMEIRKGKLYVESVNTREVKLKHRPAANIGAFDPTTVPGDITRDDTIGDMRNHVKVVYEKTEDKNTTARVVAQAKDSASIKKYGSRVHIESVNEDELGDAQKIANSKLRELQGIKTSATVELLGDDSLRSGRVINIKNKTFNLSGKYLVLNCEQIYKNSNRRMRLEIEGV